MGDGYMCGRNVKMKESLSHFCGISFLPKWDFFFCGLHMTATVELQDKIIAYRLKNGKAEAAYLTVDRLNDGNHFVVEQGLSVGDTLITEGVGQLKEGMIVTPKTTKP